MRAAVLAALLALPLAACGGSSSISTTSGKKAAQPDPRLLLPRPQPRGNALLYKIFDRLLAYSGETLASEHEMLAGASNGQRAVYALWIVDGEVNNGGFDQFFFNSSGSLMDEAIEGADLIGAKKNAAILREAADTFSDGSVPEDRESRWRIQDALSDDEQSQLSDLDDRWFGEDKNLEKLLIGYVESHPDEFLR